MDYEAMMKKIVFENLLYFVSTLWLKLKFSTNNTDTPDEITTKTNDKTKEMSHIFILSVKSISTKFSENLKVIQKLRKWGKRTFFGFQLRRTFVSAVSSTAFIALLNFTFSNIHRGFFSKTCKILQSSQRCHFSRELFFLFARRSKHQKRTLPS